MKTSPLSSLSSRHPRLSPLSSLPALSSLDFLAAVRATGCAACGWIPADYLDPVADADFRRWLEGGNHADMTWLEAHADLRLHPETVLDGVQSVICFAFRFPKPSADALPVAAYALGRNYHSAIKSRLKPFCALLEGMTGCKTRICVDSAPLPERYLAFRAGIATPGMNGMALVPGCGPYAFLAEVLTTLPVDAFPAGLLFAAPASFARDDAVPSPLSVAADVSLKNADCLRCGKCIAACPTGALSPDGHIDSRRCLSYLSIEHKGDFTSQQSSLIAHLRVPFPLLGCDRCLAACPLTPESEATTEPSPAYSTESSEPTNVATSESTSEPTSEPTSEAIPLPSPKVGAPIIPDLLPRPDLLHLTPARLLALTDSELDDLTAGTSLRRPGPAALRRNATLASTTHPPR